MNSLSCSASRLGLGAACLVFAFVPAIGPDSGAEQAGALVVVGGGGTPQVVLERALELAGGRGATVVVLPQASDAVDRGEGYVEFWQSAGAGAVRVLEDLKDAGARNLLEEADLIWLGGGAQLDLLSALREADWVEVLQARHRAGVVIGGTSAGAAALSAIMISGEPDPAPYRRGAMQAYEGIGLWPGVIVDQHLAERKRESRLITVVLDHPECLGVGISERTAVIVQGKSFAVLGEGVVLVVDARHAMRVDANKQALRSARGLKLDLLRSGDTYALESSR